MTATQITDNQLFGYKLRIQGVTRRMNQLAANDPKRSEMRAKLIELEAFIAKHSA